MNLLRESNMQLREENKHNFEECQVYSYVNYIVWFFYSNTWTSLQCFDRLGKKVFGDVIITKCCLC